jgi:hypothetical protein
MMKLPAARSSESFRFGLQNYRDNGGMNRFVFENFLKQTWHEERLAHVANDSDNITKGTLIRVA